MQALAASVRAETAARRISIAELARRVDVEKGVMYRYVRGEREFPLSILYGVAGALGTSVDNLAREAYRRMPPPPRAGSPAARVYPLRADDTPEERKAASTPGYDPHLEEEQ